MHFPSHSCTFGKAAPSVLNTFANSFVLFKVQIEVPSSRKPSWEIISFTTHALLPQVLSISLAKAPSALYFSASSAGLWAQILVMGFVSSNPQNLWHYLAHSRDSKSDWFNE